MVKAPPFEIAQVHRIAVLPFEGLNGKVVTDEFVRQLLAAGYEVLASTRGADAVLTGQVIRYQPDSKLVVFLGKAKAVVRQGPGTSTEDNPILSVVGPLAAGQGTVAVPDAQVVSLRATVGVAGRLYPLAGGTPVWLDDYSYEALQAPKALQAVVSTLVRSLQQTNASPIRNPT